MVYYILLAHIHFSFKNIIFVLMIALVYQATLKNMGRYYMDFVNAPGLGDTTTAKQSKTKLCMNDKANSVLAISFNIQLNDPETHHWLKYSCL